MPNPHNSSYQHNLQRTHEATHTDTARKTRRHNRAAAFCAITAGALFTAVIPAASAAERGSIEVGAMYMAYFDLDTSNGNLSWANAGDYAFDGPQVLRPLSVTNPGDFYAPGVPAAGLLNPHTQGGRDAAASRLFGFSLTGGLRNYLRENGYAFAIHLDSITYAGTATAADSASVFYYNRGNDDWGTAHTDKAEWSQLTNGSYLIWNGQSFSNMIHPLVVSLDDFPATYTLTYTLSIVNDATGENVNATVVDDILTIAGIDPLTFSYDAESLGATPVPEPATVVLLLGAVSLGLVAGTRRKRPHMGKAA